MIYVIDTHALVWYLEGSPRLSAKALSIMKSSDAELIVPSIVLAEVAFLFTRNRIDIDLSSVLNHISLSENCTIYPIDEVVVEKLPANLNIHDGLIVATALVFRDVLNRDVKVVTKDREISQSGLIKTVW